MEKKSEKNKLDISVARRRPRSDDDDVALTPSADDILGVSPVNSSEQIFSQNPPPAARRSTKKAANATTINDSSIRGGASGITGRRVQFRDFAPKSPSETRKRHPQDDPHYRKQLLVPHPKKMMTAKTTRPLPGMPLRHMTMPDPRQRTHERLLDRIDAPLDQQRAKIKLLSLNSIKL